MQPILPQSMTSLATVQCKTANTDHINARLSRSRFGGSGLSVGELALVTAGALATLESVTHIAARSALSSSLTTTTAHSAVTLNLSLFSALLAACGLILECLLCVEFLFASTEHPLGVAILR